MNKQNELYNDIDKPMDSQKEHQNNGPNSLGLAMEGGKGINLAIVKGKIENESDPLDENYQNQNVFFKIILYIFDCDRRLKPLKRKKTLSLKAGTKGGVFRY